MENKDRFLQLYRAQIKRPGSEELLAWLERSDFFKAPASTRFHLACEGGLCQHSLNVYDRLVGLLNDESLKAACFTRGETEEQINETVAIVSLLHDICKANFYNVEMRNRKDEHGVWQQVPYYTVDDKLPYGHGEKSVYIISGFMKLRREEAMAIRWHMGAYADKDQINTMGKAYDQFPLALMVHTADAIASHIDEV